MFRLFEANTKAYKPTIDHFTMVALNSAKLFVVNFPSA